MIDALALLTGIDIPFVECQLVAHQPTIKEIAFMGELNYFSAVQCLCINKSMISQDKSVLSNISNFQVFMTIMNEKETVDRKDNVKSLLQIIFPKYKVAFTPRSLMFIQTGENTIMIDENTFDIFQDYLKDIFCVNSQMQEQQSFNPGSDKAKEIAEKIMKGRQRVAELKGDNVGSVFGRYISILAIAQNLPLENYFSNTPYQIYDLMERYSLHTAWDIDLRCRIAGGKPDQAPDDWMKNIHGK